MTKEYTSKDVSVLAEVDHIRLNPGMYIGTTENPVHLIEEALDNALDECLAGYASVIAIDINTKENIFTVIDNGRGIPIEDEIPVTISTKLFSGAKFQDRKTAYEISSGLHGVGLVAVNALSEFYKVEIYRDNQYAIYEFKNTKLKRAKVEKFTNDAPFSTKIQFKPSKKYFETLDPDIDRIRKRLRVASAEIAKKIFVLNVDDKKEQFELNLEKFFSEDCVGKEETKSIINLNSFQKPESFNALMTYASEGSASPRIISSVNLLPVDSGGTHVNYFFEILRDFFVSRMKRGDYRFQPQDSLFRLRAYLSLNLREPKFTGQTKDRLINRKTDLDKLVKQLKIEVNNYFDKNPDYLDELLQSFTDYRKKLDAKKLTSTSVNGKRAATKYTKLRDCTSRDGELFIVEGDSAAGGLIQCRDPRTIAILPLKGKIPNISNAKDILKNKEVGELIQALGTGVSPHFDLTRLRYDKIICATDADPDGGHIACLLTMVLAILVPDIIKQGKYYIAQTPLFAINEKKSFIPLWTNKEIKDAVEKKRNVSRFKGLGELTPNQLKSCMLDEKMRKLIPVTYTKDIDEMVKLFSDSSKKRNLLDREDVIEG